MQQMTCLIGHRRTKEMLVYVPHNSDNYKFAK